MQTFSKQNFHSVGLKWDRRKARIRIILIPAAGSLRKGFLGGMVIPMLIIVLSIILTLAAIDDVKCGRISNRIIACGLAIGGSITIWQNGPMGLLRSFESMLLVFLPLYVCYLIRLLGAGDVKLISVIWLYLGTDNERLLVIWLSFLVASLMSLFAVVTKYRERGKTLKMSVCLGPAFLLGWLIYLGGSNLVKN